MAGSRLPCIVAQCAAAAAPLPRTQGGRCLSGGWAVGVPGCLPPVRGGVGWLPRPAESVVRRPWQAPPPRTTGHGLRTNDKERAVSHYTLDELIELWRRDKLTAEQMIGQIL